MVLAGGGLVGGYPMMPLFGFFFDLIYLIKPRFSKDLMVPLNLDPIMPGGIAGGPLFGASAG